jgi:hypothetical protein
MEKIGKGKGQQVVGVDKRLFLFSKLHIFIGTAPTQPQHDL